VANGKGRPRGIVRWPWQVRFSRMNDRMLVALLSVAAATALAPPVSAGAAAPAVGGDPAPASLRVWVSVRAGHDGRAVAGARVRTVGPLFRRPRAQTSHHRGPPPSPERLPDVEAVADRDGLVHLDVPVEAELARVDAPGFAPALVALGDDHADRAQAIVVPLARGGTLAFAVIGRGGAPVARAHLRASGYVEALPDDQVVTAPLQWTCTTDLRGRCLVSDVAAGIPLHIHVTSPDQVARGERDPVVVEPGARREVHIRLGRAQLQGRLNGDAGLSVAGREVWLVADDTGCGMRGAERFLLHWLEKDEVSARSVSDASGRFSFPDVPPGSWWVGPAPGDPGPDLLAPRPAAPGAAPAGPVAVAPLATRVAVPEGPTPARVEVPLHAARYIQGEVRTAAGKPISATVRVSQPGLGGCNSLHDSSWGTGLFRLGPLPPGRYTIQAGRAASGPTVAAGDSDVRLQLPAVGRIRGRVEDRRTRQPVAATVSWWSATQSGRFADPSPTEFLIDNLTPGRYHLHARTASGQTGCLPAVEVTGDRDTAGVTVAVEPGARLRIRYTGPERLGSFEVLSHATPFTSGTLHADTSTLETVPAGPLLVRFKRGPRTTEERTLDLRPGQQAELSFASAPP
jgi:hypothetical protein